MSPICRAQTPTGPWPVSVAISRVNIGSDTGGWYIKWDILLFIYLFFFGGYHLLLWQLTELGWDLSLTRRVLLWWGSAEKNKRTLDTEIRQRKPAKIATTGRLSLTGCFHCGKLSRRGETRRKFQLRGYKIRINEWSWFKPGQCVTPFTFHLSSCLDVKNNHHRSYLELAHGTFHHMQGFPDIYSVLEYPRFHRSNADLCRPGPTMACSRMVLTVKISQTLHVRQSLFAQKLRSWDKKFHWMNHPDMSSAIVNICLYTDRSYLLLPLTVRCQSHGCLGRVCLQISSCVPGLLANRIPHPPPPHPWHGMSCKVTFSDADAKRPNCGARCTGDRVNKAVSHWGWVGLNLFWHGTFFSTSLGIKTFHNMKHLWLEEPLRCRQCALHRCNM